MSPGFKRMIWRMILGSLAVIAGGIGGIRAVYVHDFWAQQGWIVLMALGAILAISGVRRGSKKSDWDTTEP